MVRVAFTLTWWRCQNILPYWLQHWFIRYRYINSKKLCKFNETRICIIWQNTLNHSQKLDFFRYFNSDHTTSNYLDLTRGIADREKLQKLQISNRKLMIELGIYNQTTIDTRNKLEVGGEISTKGRLIVSNNMEVIFRIIVNDVLIIEKCSLKCKCLISDQNP